MEQDKSPDMDNQQSENEGSEDRIKNLQSEFSRKTQNLAEELNSKLDNKMQEVLQAIQLQNQQASKSSQPDDFSSKDIYDLSPQDIDKRIEQRAQELVKPVQEKLSQQEKAAEAQAQSQNVLNEYIQEFPELSDPSNPTYKAVEKQLQSLSVEDRLNPAKFEKAIVKGLRSAPKMSASSDDFTIGGSGSSSKRKSRGKSNEVSEITKAWVQLVHGEEKLEDPEYMKSLASNSDRTWSKYKTIIKTKKGY